MYIDDIKQFAKTKKELETIWQAKRIYCENIGMEFAIEICTVLQIESEKL